MQNFFTKRLPLIIFSNLVIIIISLILAIAIRFDFIMTSTEINIFWRLLPAVITIKLILFWHYGLFHGWWRYVSMNDLLAIAKANILSSAGVIAYAVFIYRLEFIPRSILILDSLFCFLFIAGIRFSIRLWRENYYPMLFHSHNTDKRVLIVGAGSAGQMIAKEIQNNHTLQYHAFGFIDDDQHKQHTTLHGLKVLGTCNDLPTICQHKQIDEVIIAIPSATGNKIKNIVTLCQLAAVSFRTLPSVAGLIDGSVSVQQLKKVSLEDLLGRDAVQLDTNNINAYLNSKTILITGAGGSIGSEICRQITKFAPTRLILFENAETPLFAIENELRALCPTLTIFPIIGDIRYRARVEAIFDEFMPDVVFHAAAYKHVPMMEFNPAEAVNNNIRGTKIVAEAADTFNVKHFVMISTDKAVNPTNVMGATKRSAEKVVQALSHRSKTRFVTVRFGNVLGSNGSVIPTFTEQIKNGGPVTVTHKEITRFFMTIPEASQLLLQAGSMGKGGEIYLLDMGKPVQIVHLAEELIRLSGKQPYDDIAIEFTGLRPGEKLYEELLLGGEGVKTTTHEKICVATAVIEDEKILCNNIETLFSAAKQMDLTAVSDLLQVIVPEYQPEQHSAARDKGDKAARTNIG